MLSLSFPEDSGHWKNLQTPLSITIFTRKKQIARPLSSRILKEFMILSARFLKTGNLQNLSLPMNGKTSISSAPSKSFFLFFPEKENPYACLAAGIFICPDFGVHRNFQTFPLILFSFCTSFCSKDLPFILYACFFLLLFIFSQTIPCKNG